MKRKKNSRLFSKIILFALLISGFLGLIIFFLLIFSKKQLYISPLPSSFSKKNLLFFQAGGKSELIEELLKKSQIEYVSVESIGESSYRVVLKNGQEVLLSSDKDIASQVSSLQLILSRLTIEGKEFLRLDFRYNKPVVVSK